MKRALLNIFIALFFLINTDIASGQPLGQKQKVLDSLKTELLSIYDHDQESRLLLDSLYWNNPKEDSARRQSLRDSIVYLNSIKTYYDSINIIKITGIIYKYGWLSEKEVGNKANLTIFSVVQHAPFKTRKSLQPVLEKALKEGKLKPSHYALYKDRILLNEGHKQVYGSQIAYNAETKEHFVLPLINPDNVDKRRKSVGLGPLNDYVKQWNIIWNVSEYKKHEYPNLFKLTE